MLATCIISIGKLTGGETVKDNVFNPGIEFNKFKI
jgi:hypothetical protein